jgi:hypothetical protein
VDDDRAGYVVGLDEHDLDGVTVGGTDLGDSLDELADRLLRFGKHYRQIARPFD